ncbi:outer membrane protein transport protein [Halosquirtibacter laminarini]|uniref:Outer membrane protein transport protein n=1 Tax=Halosquirtibacter laminarini TaxID=3374600 RepID=A0AC61NGW0_9BACT|nr:outer membrane protein transport protein [Prolixibacteraceae bacterium]
MRSYIYILIVVLGIGPTMAHAQKVDNLMQFNSRQVGQTARSAAMGGAFGALGGDLSSVLINPAGIAVFQSSEISFTSNIYNGIDARTTYGGQMNTVSESGMKIPNFGIVGVIPNMGASSNIVNFNFGFSYNRSADFNNLSYANLDNTSSSRIDAYATQATAKNLYFDDVRYVDGEVSPYNKAPINSVLAFQGYLIEQHKNDKGEFVEGYWYSILPADAIMNQTVRKETSGYINNYTFSMGGNVNHKFYFGMALNLQDYYYEERKTYTERGVNNNITEFTHNEYLRQNAFGYSVNLGFIYRPAPFIRFGASMTTPTYFKVTEDFSASMTSDVVYDGKRENAYEESPIFKGKYEVQTPFVWNAGLAFVIGKRFILSQDVTYMDYGNSKFSTADGNVDSYAFEQTNQSVSKIYKDKIESRTGLEIRMDRNVYLRGGYQFSNSPFNAQIEGYTTADGADQIASNNTYHAYSCGIGYRTSKFFIDAAYVYDYRSENYYQYVEASEFNYVESPKTETEWTTQKLMVTLGFRF